MENSHISPSQVSGEGTFPSTILIEELPVAIPKPNVRLVRPDLLPGSTYKIEPATMEDAIYITINNAEMDDVVRPVEVFINCKHIPNYAWVSALTRIMSAVLQQPGPFPEFIIGELTESADPEGSYWIPPGQVGNPSTKGIQCPSIVAHIGLVLRDHCKRMGLLNKKRKRKK